METNIEGSKIKVKSKYPFVWPGYFNGHQTCLSKIAFDWSED